MNETIRMTIAAGTGVLLGAFFFLGLWWTVRKGLGSKRPALWFGGSLLLRTAVVIAGFHYVSGGQGPRLLACLAGFVAGRLAVTWLTREHRKEAADAHQH